MPDISDFVREFRNKYGYSPFEYHQHHNRWVWVKTEDKGKHREHCLCYACENFIPEDRDKNCGIANILYAINREFGLVAPVWECPEFVENLESEA